MREGTFHPLFGSDFVSWIFVKNFQTLLEVKIDINRVNLTPCQAHCGLCKMPLGGAKDKHFYSSCQLGLICLQFAFKYSFFFYFLGLPLLVSRAKTMQSFWLWNVPHQNYQLTKRKSWFWTIILVCNSEFKKQIRLFPFLPKSMKIFA